MSVTTPLANFLTIGVSKCTYSFVRKLYEKNRCMSKKLFLNLSDYALLNSTRMMARACKTGHPIIICLFELCT